MNNTEPYLPEEIPNAKVFVTVKAYPKPSGKYEELVCTAGFTEDGSWIRIYPVPYRFLADYEMYPKYSWINVNLARNHSDFRPESYRPTAGLDEEFALIKKIGTADNWAARKEIVLKEVFTSMSDLIDLAKGDKKKSLGVLKPLEILDLKIQPSERQWKKEWMDKALQKSFFELENSDLPGPRKLVKKVPYDFSYEFLSEGDDRPRKLRIEDWEISALYWNCLRQSGGDENAALDLVRKKYIDEFIEKKDIYFFVGTTKRYHNVSPNPFIIVGVFYPQKTKQGMLFCLT